MKLKKLVKILEGSFDEQITLKFSRDSDIGTLDYLELKKIVKEVKDIGNLKVNYFCPCYGNELYNNIKFIYKVYFHIYIKNNGTSLSYLKSLIKNWREVENSKAHYTFAD